MIKKGDVFRKQFCVSKKIYQGFITTFRDKNPLHVDKAFAKEKGFPNEVMHGNILNGFISYFVGECLPIKNVIIHSQKIEYKNPFYLNDKLNFCAEVTEVFDSVNIVALKYFFENAELLKVAQGDIQIGII